MNASEARHLGSRLLTEARALRASFPDVDAMREVRVGDLPEAQAGDGQDAPDSPAALRYLRDEMLAVRAGRASDLTVLDDEIAGVERLLRHI
jgi:hypothetical protein